MTPRRIGSPTRESQCEGKKRYGRAAAVHSAKVRTRECGEQIHAYPCRFCNHWHIGHLTFKPYDRRREQR